MSALSSLYWMQPTADVGSFVTTRCRIPLQVDYSDEKGQKTLDKILMDMAGEHHNRFQTGTLPPGIPRVDLPTTWKHPQVWSLAKAKLIEDLKIWYFLDQNFPVFLNPGNSKTPPTRESLQYHCGLVRDIVIPTQHLPRQLCECKKYPACRLKQQAASNAVPVRIASSAYATSVSMRSSPSSESSMSNSSRDGSPESSAPSSTGSANHVCSCGGPLNGKTRANPGHANRQRRLAKGQKLWCPRPHEHGDCLQVAFQSLSELRDHVDEATKPFICPDCHQRFGSRTTFDIHKKCEIAPAHGGHQHIVQHAGASFNNYQTAPNQQRTSLPTGSPPSHSRVYYSSSSSSSSTTSSRASSPRHSPPSPTFSMGSPVSAPSPATSYDSDSDTSMWDPEEAYILQGYGSHKKAPTAAVPMQAYLNSGDSWSTANYHQEPPVMTVNPQVLHMAAATAPRSGHSIYRSARPQYAPYS